MIPDNIYCIGWTLYPHRYLYGAGYRIGIMDIHPHRRYEFVLEKGKYVIWHKDGDEVQTEDGWEWEDMSEPISKEFDTLELAMEWFDSYVQAESNRGE